MPTAEQEALASLAVALRAREVADAAVKEAARVHLRYIRDARHANWSWIRIGREIGQSEVAVRRYWQRNQQGAGRAGRTDVVQE